MITGWESRDDCWTNIGSPGIVREQMLEGYLETRGHGLSGLSGHKKNGLWLLWYGSSELLRQEGAADTGFVLRGCTDLPGGGGTAGLLPGVREGEAGEVVLACQESLLYEAVCLLCRVEVSGDDGTGCGKRVEVGLAYGEVFGQGVHGGASFGVIKQWPQLKPIISQVKGLEQSAYDARIANFNDPLVTR